MNDMPILKCGCRANSMGSTPGNRTTRPACVIHSCFEVAEIQPDMTGRMARCAYYGRAVRNSECNYKGDVKEEGVWTCRCEQPSGQLPFFKHQPDKDYDEFYCGCHSWN